MTVGIFKETCKDKTDESVKGRSNHELFFLTSGCSPRVTKIPKGEYNEKYRSQGYGDSKFRSHLGQIVMQVAMPRRDWISWREIASIELVDAPWADTRKRVFPHHPPAYAQHL